MWKNKLKKGDILYLRSYIEIKHPALERHKVLGVITLGDGSVIVEHQELPLWGFLSFPVHYTNIDKFLQNCEKLYD